MTTTELNNKKKLNVYLVSDSSGETVLHVANAVLSQFENININKFMWPMVRTEAQIENLGGILKKMPGVVYYTLVDEKTEYMLATKCSELNIPCISVIRDVINKTSKLLDIPILRRLPGSKHHVISEEYEEKIKAMDFTLAHDDGQLIETVHEAQILLIGVSRTSKSPTSLYLAQRGFKTANIPFVKGIGIKIDVNSLKNTLVVGLTITPERLKTIRANRLNHLGDFSKSTEYTDIMNIKEEVIEAMRYFKENNIQVLDVTGRAIEETSAEILNIFYTRYGTDHKIL